MSWYGGGLCNHDEYDCSYHLPGISLKKKASFLLFIQNRSQKSSLSQLDKKLRYLMTRSLFCTLQNVVRRHHWFVHRGNPCYWVFSFGRMCVEGGLVSAPQIISATSPGNPSLTDSVTTPLRQNAVAWVDQNNRLPFPCAISPDQPLSPSFLPFRIQHTQSGFMSVVQQPK